MSEGGRGRLKVYMGYAAGVGKTYQMLEEAHQLKNAGVDVVVGYFEPHGRKDTIAKVEGLALVPRRRIAYRGTEFEEMDTDAILARHPRVCAVDEFPHTNVPGSERRKRWEDVEVLREAGIDVLTTMNIQHLESLSDQVWHITGVRVRETIPDWVVNKADEVVMVDVTPRALRHRLERGVVYGPEKAQSAMDNFFRESTLAALRELAMRETAHEATLRLPEEEGDAAGSESAGSGRHHKILVVATPAPETAMLIRRAKRVGDFLGAECFAAAALPGADLGALGEADREALERHLNFARNLHIETRILDGREAAPALIDFARRNEITQIFVARSRERGRGWFARDTVREIVGRATDMQVVIVSDRAPARRT